jgi:hypothetical protein
MRFDPVCVQFYTDFGRLLTIFKERRFRFCLLHEETVVLTNVADPDPAGSGPFLPDPVPGFPPDPAIHKYLCMKKIGPFLQIH